MAIVWIPFSSYRNFYFVFAVLCNPISDLVFTTRVQVVVLQAPHAVCTILR